LGFARYGPPAENPVYFFHASGGSRLMWPQDEALLARLKIQFITLDRPGHGRSDPQPGRALLDWPDDVVALAYHLGHKQFYVAGWSAGGPYALACAYKLPDRVRAGAILCGLAPPDRPQPYRGLPWPNRLLMFGGRRLSCLVYLLRYFSWRMITQDRAGDDYGPIATFPEIDRRLLHTPQQREDFVRDIREGYRQGWRGPAQDDVLINRPWGFCLKAIIPRIDLWQGGKDKNVPAWQAHYQAERIPHSRLTLWPHLGHLGHLAHWSEVLAALIDPQPNPPPPSFQWNQPIHF
jgi:pimeloyl-ACP methyl ester carboxylesterase